MKIAEARRDDRILRVAAWFYVARRVVIGALVLAAFALASFMVVIPLVRTLLRHF